jgi:hypothetical protein
VITRRWRSASGRPGTGELPLVIEGASIYTRGMARPSKTESIFNAFIEQLAEAVAARLEEKAARGGKSPRGGKPRKDQGAAKAKQGK